MKGLILALLLAPALALANPTSHGQVENMADPADCGLTACPTYGSALADFPYWDRQITGFGFAGPVDGVPDVLFDGSYVYLGTINGYGYSVSSEHNGPYQDGVSIVFVSGPHAGKHYRTTGVNPLIDEAHEVMHMQQLEPMQYAPGCIEVGRVVAGSDACCDGYGLGDGTCSNTGAGRACDANEGGCVTEPLPDLPFVKIASKGDLVPGSTLLLTWGLGNRSSQQREWYLECTNDDTRGGIVGQTKHACCTGIEFNGDLAVNSNYRTILDISTLDPQPQGLPGSEGQFVIGGVGHNCDTYGGGPGYTYLGPFYKSAGVGEDAYAPPDYSFDWVVGYFAGFPGSLPGVPGLSPLITVGLYDEPHRSVFRSTATETKCWAGYDWEVDGWFSTNLADHVSKIRPPLPRNGARADCIGTDGVPGDSGSPVFAKVNGEWTFLGQAPAGKFETMVFSSVRWGWWEVVMGKPFGRGGY